MNQTNRKAILLDLLDAPVINPLLRVYKTTNETYYAFDGGTSQLLILNPLTARLVRHYQPGKSDALHTLVPQFSSDDFHKASETLEYLFKEKIVTYGELQKVPVPSKEDIVNAYAGKLHQLGLEVTESCNFRCSYCSFSGGYNDQRSHGSDMMSFETARAAIDFYSKANPLQGKFRFISFYGGEPTLALPLLEKVTKYVEKLGEKDPTFRPIVYDPKGIYETGGRFTNLTSNLYSLSDRLLDWLVKNNVSLLVSLDGPKHLHDRYRKTNTGEPTFDKVMANLEKIRSKYPEYYSHLISFNMVVYDADDFEEIENFIAEHNEMLRVENVKISLIKQGHKDFPITNEVVQKVSRWGIKLFQDYIDAFEEDREIPIMSRVFTKSYIYHLFRILEKKVTQPFRPYSGCFPGMRKMLVSPNGDIHMCERVSRYLQLGWVREHGIQFDWENVQRLLIEFYELINEKRCLQCYAVPMCNVCFSHAYEHDKMIHKTFDETCSGQLSTADILFSHFLESYSKFQEKWNQHMKDARVTEIEDMMRDIADVPMIMMPR